MSAAAAATVSPGGASGRVAPATPGPAFRDAVETLAPERLEQAALERLRVVLERAARLPFYRERLRIRDAGTLHALAELADALPPLRKRDLLAELRRGGGYRAGIEALSGPPAAIALTSGTSGLPTFALLGAGELEHGSASEVERELRMDGVRPGMRVMCQYPAWHHLSLLDNRALERIGAEVACPWGTFLPRFAADAIELIAAWRPEYLLTVTTMLHAIVEAARARGLAPRALFGPVRYVMVAGEPVSPAERAWLVAELGLDDLFERGGSSDGLWGGAECPAHAGHHVWWDHHHVEVLDLDTGAPLPAGERGTVVVTNLTDDRSLYLRFDTEDLGELLPGACPCGRTHPRVELYGRLADCVRVGPRLVAPYDVRACLDELPELVGVPIVVVRERAREGVLSVRVDESARAHGVARAARERLEAGLGLAAEVAYAGPLPRRWKARTTTAGPSAGGRWARR